MVASLAPPDFTGRDDARIGTSDPLHPMLDVIKRGAFVLRYTLRYTNCHFRNKRPVAVWVSLPFSTFCIEVMRMRRTPGPAACVSERYQSDRGGANVLRFFVQ
jgi:hypothetical protein